MIHRIPELRHISMNHIELLLTGGMLQQHSAHININAHMQCEECYNGS